jgi:hypothetical protein
MSTKIRMTTARLDDAASMTAFLAPMPNGQQLAEMLESGHPFSSRAYDDDSWTAVFVESDGAQVSGFAVTDITIDQAEMIAAACPSVRAMSESAFRGIVAQALGPTFDPAD